MCNLSETVLLFSVRTDTQRCSWTVARQAPPPVGFLRQECWSGLPFPPPEDLPNPGIKSVSPVSPALAGGFFTTEPPGKLFYSIAGIKCHRTG